MSWPNPSFSIFVSSISFNIKSTGYINKRKQLYHYHHCRAKKNKFPLLVLVVSNIDFPVSVKGKLKLSPYYVKSN